MPDQQVLPVSLVIPTRNRPESLLDAIASVAAGTHVPAQLIVAEQSATKTAGLDLDPRITLDHLHLDSVGLSRARNAGIEAAEKDVLVFIDDDMTVEPGWLRALHSALVNAGEGTVVTGQVLPVEVARGHVPSCTTWTEAAVFQGRQFADPLHPGNMAVHASVFATIGTFDPQLGAGARFPAAEDNDFGHRLLDAGHQIHLVPDAVVTHHGVRIGHELYALDWSYGRGQGAFYAKHDVSGDPHGRERLRRNVRYRLRSIARVWRGDTQALHDAVYLAAMLSAYVSWRRSHRPGSTG